MEEDNFELSKRKVDVEEKRMMVYIQQRQKDLELRERELELKEKSMKVKEGEQAFVRAKLEIMQQRVDQIEEQNRYIIRLLSQNKND